MRDYIVGIKDTNSVGRYTIKYYLFGTYTEAYVFANQQPKRGHKHETIIAHRLFTGSFSQWRNGQTEMNVIG